MKAVVTSGVVLNRINFGEADRIITVLTPDQGKLRLMAKGVRKVKSKLAGGIELFSISAITFIPGKRDISTLVSTRLVTHFGNIVANIECTTTGYEILKLIDKSTQDHMEADFYELLIEALQNLNDQNVEPSVTESWFRLRLLKLLGHEPNLTADSQNNRLEANKKYIFDFDAMAFNPNASGKYTQNHIKLLRLYLSQPVDKLQNIEGIDKINKAIKPLIKTMFEQAARV